MENNRTQNPVSEKKTNFDEDDNPLIEIKKRKLTETKTNKANDAVTEKNSSHMKNAEKRKMASKERYTVMTSGVENYMTKNPVSNNTSSDEDDIPLFELKKRKFPETETNKVANAVMENNSSSIMNAENRELVSEEQYTIMEEQITEKDYWKTELKALATCRDYKSLSRKVQSGYTPITSNSTINCLLEDDEVDSIALGFLPPDAPSGLVPIKCGADGNCLPRSVSRVVRGNEEHHLEFRSRIAIEAITNKQLYLNDTYLMLGRPSSDGMSLSKKYSIYSQCYDPKKSIKEIYEEEILTICKNEAYMGLWQLHQVANVLK